jgi:hypothetical protein
VVTPKLPVSAASPVTGALSAPPAAALPPGPAASDVTVGIADHAGRSVAAQNPGDTAATAIRGLSSPDDKSNGYVLGLR